MSEWSSWEQISNEIWTGDMLVCLRPDGLKMGVNPKAEAHTWIIFSLTLWIPCTKFLSLLDGISGIFFYKLFHWLEWIFVTGMRCSNGVSHCQKAVMALLTFQMWNSTFSLPLLNRRCKVYQISWASPFISCFWLHSCSENCCTKMPLFSVFFSPMHVFGSC